MLTTTVAGRMSRSPTLTPYWKTLMTWSGSASASKSVIAASWIVGSKGTPTSSIFSAPSSLNASSKAAATGPVWKSKFYGAFIVLHAIDATPARWRGDAGSSPLDGARTRHRRAPDALVDFHAGRDPCTYLQLSGRPRSHQL